MVVCVFFVWSSVGDAGMGAGVVVLMERFL